MGLAGSFWRNRNVQGGSASPELYCASHFGRACGKAMLSEASVKSVVCMSERSSPQQADDALMTGWRVGLGTDRGTMSGPFHFSLPVSYYLKLR